MYQFIDLCRLNWFLLYNANQILLRKSNHVKTRYDKISNVKIKLTFVEPNFNCNMACYTTMFGMCKVSNEDSNKIRMKSIIHVL